MVQDEVMNLPPELAPGEAWYRRSRIDDSLTLLVEPHVIELMRCNVWHLRGRSRDLLIDTGMGLVSLAAEITDLVDKPVVAVATHGHDDHIGGHHEFDDVRAHPAEAGLLLDPPLTSLSPREAWGDQALADLSASGYDLDDPWFVTAVPAGFAVESFRQQPCAAVHPLQAGDVVDLGDRAFEVLHLPGHSPGSIGLWDAASGTLFSGDAIYDGPLLDELPDSDISDYCATMRRLLTLPVDVVHAGHDPSFGRARLRELACAYLERRA
jgi:glyoxylase-like metal-dependent hydrolase (beta-lactamase superfamily II)